MSKQVEDFPIFDGRYLVDIGKGGKVTVKSKAQHNRALKVYGKKKQGLRFVNLTEHTGAEVKSYDLEVIKSHCVDSVDLVPLSKEEISQAVKREDMPELLNDPDIIESLPTTTNKFNNTVYLEELEYYKRYYTKQYLGVASNGLSKFRYKVGIYYNYDNYKTDAVTGTFICDGKSVGFYSVANINDSELDAIFKLVNDERIKRKLEQFQSDFRKAYPSKYKEESLEYKVYQEDRLNS